MRIMKRFLSLMLAAVLVISSFFLGLGQIKASAVSQATGQLGTYRLRVTTAGQDCGGSGTANNLVVTINFFGATNWSTTVPGESSPNYFEAGNTDNITFTSVPAKPISSITYDSQGSDRWKTTYSYFDYSPDGGTTWLQIASMVGFDGTGIRTFSYPSTYSLNTTSLNHTLTFNANGGTGGTQIYSEYGATLPASNIPAVTRTGYTFTGWSPAVPGTGPGTDVTYTAQWTPNNVTITFDANGGTGGTGGLMTCGAALTAPTVTRAGYTFTGWSPAVPATVPYANTTYTAQWRETDPAITFNSNGGSAVGTLTPGYNNAAAKPADPVKEEYTFGGWFANPGLTSPVIWPFTVTQSVTFYAEWNAENCYTIIFDANGGTGGTKAAMPAGNPLASPAVARTGYTLAGWSPAVPATIPAENTIYTAQWSANTYTVAYNGNGNDAGSTVDSSHTYDISACLTPNGFTKTGNTFLGWSTNQNAAAAAYTDSQSVVNLTPNQGEVITLFAVWSANSYTITFSANGGSGGTSASLLYGAALTAPTVMRPGYTFTGWSPEVPATVPAANTTYTAQWTANTYTVTFDPQGGTVSPTGSVVTYGSTYGAGTGGFPTPTKTGYTFGGWYTGTGGSGATKSSTTTVSTAANHTLYAKWTAITYTVVYNGNGSTGGSTSSTSHTYDTAKALRTNGFTATGYAFAGWATSADGDVVYSDGQSVINLTAASGTTVTLYAKWTNVNVSTVTFDANGGTGGKSVTLLIGAALTAPTVTRTNYTFAGWSPAVPATAPAMDTTYTAQWTPKTYTVTFNPQSGTVTPTTSTVTYGSTYGAGTGGLPTPTRTGYTFGGWYTGTGGAGTNILSSTTVTITSSQTLYAKWTAFTYTVAYNGNGSTGGSTANSTHTYDVARILTTNGFTKTGYTFTGWATSPGGSVVYTNSQSVGNLTTTNGDIINLYAVWSANTYTVVYNGNNSTGGSTASSTHTYDAAKALTANGFTKMDYTFAGWAFCADGDIVYADSQSVINLTSTGGITVTLYARWSNSNSNTVIYFDANGGTGGTGSNMTAGDPLTAPAVTRTGYTFSGWLPAVPATVPAVDTIYVAQWTANTYTINYDGNGGTGSTASSLHTYDVSSGLTANGFVKTNYGLLGWATDPGAVTAAYTDGQSVINLTPNPDAVITFYAVWANQVTITFNANGGTGGSSGLLTCGAALTAPTVTRTGYTFAGWSPAVPATVPAADTTYTAQWTVNQFTVTFDPQGGTVSPTGSVVTYGSTYGAGTGGFPTPVRTGYTFGGWYTGTGGSGTNITSSTAVTITAAQTLYAKWANTFTYTVANSKATITKYNGSGGDVTVPNTLGGYPVTAIASQAFYNYTSITSLALPASLITIGPNAFNGCSEITSIIIPDSVRTLDYYAFSNCTKLKNVIFGSGLSELESIGAHAFQRCYALNDVIIPGTVTAIESLAFCYCTALTHISIPNSVTTYGDSIFLNCTALSDVSLPNNLTQVAANIFSGCTSLTGIVIPAGVTAIGDGAFDGCTKLVSVNIPNSVTRIEEYLFNNCTSLTSIVIPAGVTAIGDGAFDGCTKLESVNIPDGVTRVEDNLFLNCTSLKQITIPGNATEIGGGAFEYCTGLTTITIPGSVSSIEQRAFNNCAGLAGAYFWGAPPVLGTNVFTNCASGFTVYHLIGNTGFTSPTWYDYPTAVFYPNGHTITFDANGGTGGTSSTMSSGDPLTAPTVTRAGYTFAGWSPEVPATVPAVDTTYTAQWIRDIVYIIWNPNGGKWSDGSNDSKTTTTLDCPGGLTRVGYTFTGWSPIVPYTMPSVNTTYTAQWEANSYTITFEANGGTGGTSTSMLYGSTLTAPTATREGYNFIGWSPEVPATVPAADTAYTAQWAVNSYTITFNANGGSAVTAITQDYGTSVVKPTDPVKAGCTFAGWYTDAALTNAVAWPYIIGTSNVTFYAKWTASTVHFTVSSASGMTGDTITVSVSVSENSNLGAITLVMPYDPAVLEVVSYSAGSILNGFALDVNNNETALTITLAAAGSNKLTAGGSILDVQFRIKGSAPAGTINTGAYIPELTDTATPANPLPFDITQGSITISKLGDVNGSGTITAVDALMVLQAATGRITLTAEQLLAADVNKSGTITAVDALMILQYATGKLTSF